jgi:hypothetical protein
MKVLPAIKSMLFNNVLYLVGDGKNINIWSDPWLKAEE